ncbi:hypothetical protein O4443_08565 [Xylella fastidiosa subsp. pauca]|nr:hypothetical protein [Xylella fastidiosa]WGZ33716.1 hypothetical protein O4445_08590 [Xylella fastidiosa subsp. pauca]WGZ36039.1 hypothetical protein O4443_08565 [Xylella fastidiosa subsp. pauca]
MIAPFAVAFIRFSIDCHICLCARVSACSSNTFTTISPFSLAIAASSAACFSVITPPFRHLLTADRLTPIFFPSVSPFAGKHIDIALSSSIFLAFMWIGS